MSDLKLVSPLLDGFVLGNPMAAHNGIRCCPALKEEGKEKYIVKIISVPASQVQLDALLLTRAYRDPAEAMEYFKSVADGIIQEAEFLKKLSRLDGFLECEGWQIESMDDGKLGYEVYLLYPYRRSLDRYSKKNAVTHLDAINLSLDLCAALAICRRAGYIYVDLKPSNIFISKGKGFKIGDLGFVSLDALKYSSLPGQYRSAYSPPEFSSDLTTLNTTVDTYAVGMILYQLFNNGVLPDRTGDPAEAFPNPSNADYELAEIIMKAIAPKPEDRWNSPLEMGQALVAYMQRNKVNNTPIMPATGILTPISPISAPLATPSVEIPREETAVPDVPEIAEEAETNTEPMMEPADEPVAYEPAQTTPIAADVPAEEIPDNETEAAPGEPAAEIHPEVNFQTEDDLDLEAFLHEFSEEAILTEEPKESKTAAPELSESYYPEKPKSAVKKIISFILVVLILGGAAIGGYWFYQNQYLQTIDTLTIEGTQNAMTVIVETDMNEADLLISCTDTYGNETTQPLANGQAVFTDLLPGSLYKVEVKSTGFHKLTGQTDGIFTTDSRTSIVSFTAVTGSEDGSVILNFTIDGSDHDEWMVTCSTDGETDITETFTGHSVTVKGLTVGKLYSLTLSASDGTEILGNNSLDYKATAMIVAEDLTIVSCQDGNMTVQWKTPKDAVVESWAVRCYSDNGHEESLEVTGNQVVLGNIDPNNAYTVEVTAAGMTQSSIVSITANPLRITAFNTDYNDDDSVSLNWEYDGLTPADGWLVIYSMDNLPEQKSIVKCEDSSAVIQPRIPGATYHVEIQAADSTSIFDSEHAFDCPNAEIYNGHGLSASKIKAYLLETPEDENWNAENVSDDAYTDTFTSGASVSVVLKADARFDVPHADIQVLYVIRDGEGNVINDLICEETLDWYDIWYDAEYRNGELTIPAVPKDAGDYSVSIYFNNRAVTSTTFTIED